MRPVTVLYIGEGRVYPWPLAPRPRSCLSFVEIESALFELDCFEALALTAGIYVGIATRAVSMSLRGHRLTRDSRPEQYDLE